MDNTDLISIAYKAKENSYAPYSGFHVGAALLCSNGKVFTGCNIENSAFSPTICAERTAIFKAISEGEKSFVKIAIVSDTNDYTYPCGVCRQVLSEFNKDIIVVVSKGKTEYSEMPLSELLPHMFNL